MRLGHPYSANRAGCGSIRRPLHDKLVMWTLDRRTHSGKRRKLNSANGALVSERVTKCRALNAIVRRSGALLQRPMRSSAMNEHLCLPMSSSLLIFVNMVVIIPIFDSYYYYYTNCINFKRFSIVRSALVMLQLLSSRSTSCSTEPSMNCDISNTLSTKVYTLNHKAQL